MITTEKLKSFNDILKETQIQVEELLRIRQNEKLFKNADDYYVQLKACEFAPQDYYKARFFDTQIQLKFSFRSKEYYIFLESIKEDFTRNISFQEFISKNKLKYQLANKNNFYIPQENNFEQVCKIFYKFCHLILGFYISEENLFYYK